MDDEPEKGLDLEFLITGFVYGLTFLVGIIGNTLIVYSVIHFKRMKSLSNVFLASLATADLILIIFCVPVKFAQLFSHTWTFGIFLCKFVHYIQNLCAICSVYTLTAMSIERYYAIIYPVECRYICTMSQTKKVITIIWFSSILLALPVIWMQKHLQVGDYTLEYKAYWCVRDWDNPLFWKLYELYMLTIILIIPTIIMSYSYSRICARLWTVMNKRPNTLFSLHSQATTATTSAYYDVNNNNNSINETNITFANNNNNNNIQTTTINQDDLDDDLEGDQEMPDGDVVQSKSIAPGSAHTPIATAAAAAANQKQLNNNSNNYISKTNRNDIKQMTSANNIYIDSSYKKMSQVIKMLIVVVIIFVLCWTPILLIHVLTAFQVIEKLNYGHMKAIKTAFHLFSYTNSCVNPIIYGFMSRNFRASFKAALTRCLGIKNNDQKQIII